MQLVAVGEGIVVDGKLKPISVKENDKFIFKNTQQQTSKRDEEYLVINEKDILAVISKRSDWFMAKDVNTVKTLETQFWGVNTGKHS